MSNYDCKGCKHRTNHTDEGFKFCSGCDRAYGGADRGYHADRYEKEESEVSNGKEFSDGFMQDIADLLELCMKNQTDNIGLTFEINGNVLDLDITFSVRKKEGE